MYQTMNQSLPPQWREVLPTFKQLALLKRLGCSRTPQTKAEAYRLIEETFTQKGGTPSGFQRLTYSNR